MGHNGRIQDRLTCEDTGWVIIGGHRVVHDWRIHGSSSWADSGGDVRACAPPFFNFIKLYPGYIHLLEYLLIFLPNIYIISHSVNNNEII